MAAYKNTLRARTDRERLARAARTARSAMLDFWQEYVDAVGGPERIEATHQGRTTLNVFQAVNGFLASVDRRDGAL